MSTLFQLHADMNTLKSATTQMANFWQDGDSVLLLGETAAYLEWFAAYVAEINQDEDSDKKIENINALYLLSDDIKSLNNSAKSNISFDAATIIKDDDWVCLTQQMDKVISLTA